MERGTEKGIRGARKEAESEMQEEGCQGRRMWSS